MASASRRSRPKQETLDEASRLPVALLRHSIYDLRDRCHLKSFQETHRDWQKSKYFVPLPPC